MNIKLSKHAATRLAQRGIQKSEFDLFYSHADKEVLVPGNCLALSISQKRYDNLTDRGLSARTAERIRKVIALISGDGTVVTVMKDRGPKSRAYRSPVRPTRH